MRRAALALLALAVLADAPPAAVAQDTSRARVIAVACMQRALRETDLAGIAIERLCWGTPSPDAPIDCYLVARSELLTDAQSIELCRCTGDLTPIVCVQDLRRASLSPDPEILAACSPTSLGQLGWDCAPARRP